MTPADKTRAQQIAAIIRGDGILAVFAEVAEAVGVAPGIITGRQQTPDAVMVRDLACHVAHDRGYSYAAIGRAIGRDHTSVMDAVRREIARRK